MCDLGFYKEIEGLLGEGIYLPKLLILLREPHEERAKTFWFKEDVVQVKADIIATKKVNGTGTRYYNIFSILAGKLLKVEDEKKREGLLRKCAYMNLRPDGGEGKRSEQYYQVLEEFKKVSLDNSDGITLALEEIDWNRPETARKVAQNRMGIIQNAIAGGADCIVTTPDIYDAICDVMKKHGQVKEEKEYKLGGIKKKYRYCRVGEGGKTTLFAFPHPSWTGIRHEDLKNLDVSKF